MDDLSKTFTKKSFSDIMQELKHDFNNDFDTYCLNYQRTEKQMLQELSKRLDESIPLQLSLLQITLLVGLQYVIVHLSADDYLKYLGYILNPKYTDEYRRETLFEPLNELLMKNTKLEALAESGEWRKRAFKILSKSTYFHEGDINVFVDKYWKKLHDDIETIGIHTLYAQSNKRFNRRIKQINN